MNLGKSLRGIDVKKYLTLPQAFELSHIPIKTLRTKIAMGLLPAYKPGRSILIDENELEIFIRKSRKKIAS